MVGMSMVKAGGITLGKLVLGVMAAGALLALVLKLAAPGLWAKRPRLPRLLARLGVLAACLGVVGLLLVFAGTLIWPYSRGLKTLQAFGLLCVEGGVLAGLFLRWDLAWTRADNGEENDPPP